MPSPSGRLPGGVPDVVGVVVAVGVPDAEGVSDGIGVADGGGLLDGVAVLDGAGVPAGLVGVGVLDGIDTVLDGIVEGTGVLDGVVNGVSVGALGEAAPPLPPHAASSMAVAPAITRTEIFMRNSTGTVGAQRPTNTQNRQQNRGGGAEQKFQQTLRETLLRPLVFGNEEL